MRLSCLSWLERVLALVPPAKTGYLWFEEASPATMPTGLIAIHAMIDTTAALVTAAPATHLEIVSVTAVATTTTGAIRQVDTG